MDIDHVESKKAEPNHQDEHDVVLKKYEKLYEIEKIHSKEIKIDNQYSLNDYDNGRLNKKLNQHAENRHDLMM